MYMLFLLSFEEGLRTFLEEFLSFHAFWREMKPLLCHSSTLSTTIDRKRLLSAAVQKVQALQPCLQDQRLAVMGN